MPQLLTQAQIDTALQEIHGWTQQGEQIVKEVKCKDFAKALALLNAAAAKAEAADHHPDMLLHSWNRVKFFLSTHSAGGITDNDIALAREIDQLPAE
jgi:4a-hydroxytetrahydrobiopterin dehydratase